MTSVTLNQFWRCPVCGIGRALGDPGTFTWPPICRAHGEMEQCTAEGFKADIDAGRDEADTDE
jgi:hypothetical protein